MAEPRKKIDWEKVEEAYRAGKLSLREIGAEFGVTHGAIRKRAARDGWARDLSARIKAKADALVSKAEVSSEVSNKSLVSEKEIIEANAQAILDIRLSHRADIRRAKKLVAKLFHEVENAVQVEGEEKPAETLTIPQRVDCTRKLTDAAKVLVAMERDAWGIRVDDESESGRIIATITRRIIDAES